MLVLVGCRMENEELWRRKLMPADLEIVSEPEIDATCWAINVGHDRTYCGYYDLSSDMTAF